MVDREGTAPTLFRDFGRITENRQRTEEVDNAVTRLVETNYHVIESRNLAMEQMEEIASIQLTQDFNPEHFEFTPRNFELENAQRELEQQEINIRTATNNLEESATLFKRRLKRYIRNKREYFTYLRIQKLQPRHLATQILNLVHAHTDPLTWSHDEFITRHESYTHALNYNQIQLRREELELFTTHLNSARQKVSLFMLNPDKNNVIIIPKDITKAINSIEGFKVLAMTADSDQLHINIRAEHIEVGPADGEEDKARSLAGDKLTFTLLPFSFRITINTNTDYYLQVYEPTKNFRGYSGHYIVHPHWLSNNSFCFGAFGSTFSECVKAFDIVSALCVLRSALAYYNPSDEAGVSFTAWLGLDVARTDNEDYDDDEDGPPMCENCDETEENCICNTCDNCHNHYNDCACEN